MPYKTAIDCIEELATQCFLSKLTDDDVSTFRRACSRENDIIKLALKVPQTVDYTSILRLLYDTLPLKFLSFNEALPLFCYSIDPAQQRQCDLRFYLRDVVKLAKPRKRLEMQKALSQWLPSLLSNVTLQLLNDIRTPCPKSACRSRPRRRPAAGISSSTDCGNRAPRSKRRPSKVPSSRRSWRRR